MWKMIRDDRIVDNENNEAYFVRVAMISQDEYEQRIEEFFDDIDTAKKALAEKFAQLKAEDEKLLWKIDEDGNAFSGSDKIFWGTLTKSNNLVGYAVIKETDCVGIKNYGVLRYANSVSAAKEFIRQFVAKLNAEVPN